jgi:hypothetical protein
MPRKASQRWIKTKKMKNPIWSKVVQGDLKVMKKTVMERRSREAEADMKKRNKNNNLSRNEVGYPIFVGALHSARFFS